MRRLLIEGTYTAARGDQPPGVDPAAHRGIRPHGCVIHLDADWHEVIVPNLVAK
jgi:hypothetical protein